MGKKINDGDISGLKQDKFRNSRFEYDNRENDSYRLGGVSRRYGGSRLDHEGSHFGKGPKGYKRSDDSIYEDVCYDLTVSPDVDASDIQDFLSSCS